MFQILYRLEVILRSLTVAPRPWLLWGDKHTGIDLEDMEGEPVYCAEAGHVVWVRDFREGGRAVRVAHDVGTVRETLYACLGEVPSRIVAGAPMARGQIVGWIGRVPGRYPHLHFECWAVGKDDGVLRDIDPMPFLQDALNTGGVR